MIQLTTLKSEAAFRLSTNDELEWIVKHSSHSPNMTFFDTETVMAKKWSRQMADTAFRLGI